MVAEVFRADPRRVLPAGGAIEMVHTASLILDDLPSMDDARARRGRPACHVAHGEATAILAAFALLNRAYEILAEGWPDGPDAAVRAELARDLARAVGLDGMIAGQSEDLRMTDRADRLPDPRVHPQPEDGRALHLRGRPGRGGRARLRGGDGGRDRLRQEPRPAFQIVDDLIDVTGEAAAAGKDVGQDLKKTTFVSFSGVEGARQLAAELVHTSRGGAARVRAARAAAARSGPLRGGAEARERTG